MLPIIVATIFFVKLLLVASICTFSCGHGVNSFILVCFNSRENLNLINRRSTCINTVYACLLIVSHLEENRKKIRMEKQSKKSFIFVLIDIFACPPIVFKFCCFNVRWIHFLGLTNQGLGLRRSLMTKSDLLETDLGYYGHFLQFWFQFTVYITTVSVISIVLIPEDLKWGKSWYKMKIQRF